MLARCYRQSHMHFKHYGGRGILVCERWIGAPHGFEAFVADMGHPPDGMTLDRKDNNGPYSPENCQWATVKQQVRNSRVAKHYDVEGRMLLAAEIAAICGISESAMRWRLKHWGLEKVISTLPAVA